MKTIHTWIGCAVVVMGLSAMPVLAEDQPDLSGPPVQQDGARHGGPEGGRQFNGDRAGRPGDRMMEIVKQLNLTEDQKAKVHEILKANAGSMAEHRKAMKAAMDEMRAAMESKDQEKIKAAREKVKALRDGDRDKVIEQLSAVLTDEQKAKFQELVKQEMKDRMAPGNGGPEGRRDGPLEGLQGDLAKLNLTEDQKAQIQDIVKTHRQAMEKYVSEHKDQMEQLRKKIEDARQTKDREAAQAAREELKKLMEAAPVKPKDLIDQISKVLTEEQAKQLRQAIQEHRSQRGPGGPGDEMGGPRRRGPGGPDGGRSSPQAGDQLDL